MDTHTIVIMLYGLMNLLPENIQNVLKVLIIHLTEVMEKVSCLEGRIAELEEKNGYLSKRVEEQSETAVERRQVIDRLSNLICEHADEILSWDAKHYIKKNDIFKAVKSTREYLDIPLPLARDIVKAWEQNYRIRVAEDGEEENTWPPLSA
jgi:uncharacterized coiled-coil protein SlyX